MQCLKCKSHDVEVIKSTLWMKEPEGDFEYQTESHHLHCLKCGEKSAIRVDRFNAMNLWPDLDSLWVVDRWAPSSLNANQIMRIIQYYGTDNDSLLREETLQNIVPWKIAVKVRQL